MERSSNDGYPLAANGGENDRESWLRITPEDFTEVATSFILLEREQKKPLRLTLETGYFLSDRDCVGLTGHFHDADVYIPPPFIGFKSWEKALNDLSQGSVGPTAVMLRMSKLGRDQQFTPKDIMGELALIHESRKAIKAIAPPSDHPVNEILKSVDFAFNQSLPFDDALLKFRASYEAVSAWLHGLSLYKLRILRDHLRKDPSVWKRPSSAVSIVVPLGSLEASLWIEAFQKAGTEAGEQVSVVFNHAFPTDTYNESVLSGIHSNLPVSDELVARAVLEQLIGNLLDADLKALSVPTWQLMWYIRDCASRFSLGDIEKLYTKIVVNPQDQYQTTLEVLSQKGVTFPNSKQDLRQFVGIGKSEWRDPEKLSFIPSMKQKGTDWWDRFRRRTITYEKKNVAKYYLKDLGLLWSDLVGKRVLDIGAGSGGFIKIAREKGIDAIALDKNPEDHLRSFAGGKKLERGIPYLKGDAWNLPFADHSFDMVVSHALFHNIIQDRQDIPRWLEEVKRVLRPGGECRISFGTPGNMVDWGYAFFTDEELAAVPAEELDVRGGQEELADRIAVALSKLLSTHDPTAALIRVKGSDGDSEYKQRDVFVVKNV